MTPARFTCTIHESSMNACCQKQFSIDRYTNSKKILRANYLVYWDKQIIWRLLAPKKKPKLSTPIQVQLTMFVIFAGLRKTIKRVTHFITLAGAKTSENIKSTQTLCKLPHFVNVLNNYFKHIILSCTSIMSSCMNSFNYKSGCFCG